MEKDKIVLPDKDLTAEIIYAAIAVHKARTRISRIHL